jgi:hypothetical protein
MTSKAAPAAEARSRTGCGLRRRSGSLGRWLRCHLLALNRFALLAEVLAAPEATCCVGIGDAERQAEQYGQENCSQSSHPVLQFVSHPDPYHNGP